MRPTPFLTLASLLSLVAAHGPDTPAEVAAFKARQESIYHCAPKIKQYVAARKTAAQQALGASPTEASSMFIGEGAFDELQSGDKMSLECSKMEEMKIRNHTCVLAPETTQGEHGGGAPSMPRRR